jgi:hypothetical protein
VPHATLVVDRVRKDDPEYGLRRRLLRNREDLTEEKFADMWNRLVDLGPAGGTGPGRVDREGGTPRAAGVSSRRCLS